MKVYGRYDKPVRIAEGIYWVGARDKAIKVHCNPYLIIEDDQAVLIDGGSRADFSVVMMKILQAGVDPGQIVALIYQHYDPDLCGSMANLIDMCENPDLKVFSETINKVFVSFYIHREKYHLLESVDDHDFVFSFNDRALRFLKTPYAHTPGSFVTYDEKTRTLFSSDLFGSFSTEWDLILQLDEECYTCEDYENCPRGKAYCPLPDILAFHKTVMPSTKALRHAMARIRTLDMDRIAPQHGSILRSKKDISSIIERIEALDGVGIDAMA